MLDALSSSLSAALRAQKTAPAFVGNTPAATATASTPDDFTSMLTQMIGDTSDKLRKAEATAIAGIQGKTSVQEVVETVMAADQSLQAAIAVRDKITNAYLELSRMNI
jgi:flagellar hook-basal body complex protein FliE